MKYLIKILCLSMVWISCEPGDYGCQDANACNYDPQAVLSNGRCIYLEDKIEQGYCNCDNEIYDCAGICGGDSVLDCTGQCNGNEYQPNNCFDYNQSDLIAFYFFQQVLINDQSIDAEDWVAAFNGDVCVGAKKWDCSSPPCELPVYGYNSINPLTGGYMLPGDIPSFKIYDASDNIYYDALPSTDIPWQNGDFFNQIETLSAE